MQQNSPKCSLVEIDVHFFIFLIAVSTAHRVWSVCDLSSCALYWQNGNNEK